MSTSVALAVKLTMLALPLIPLVGCQHLGQNKVAKATSLFSGSSRDSAKLDLQFAMAQSLESVGDLEGAEKNYQAVVDKDGKNVAALHRLAVLYDRKGNVAASDPLYERALKQRPNDPEILCDRGYSFYLRRDWSAAESSLRKAIELQPELKRAHVNLGLVLARTKRQAEAYDHFTSGGCNVAEAHCNIAFGLSVEGDMLAAQQEYEFALQANPDFGPAREGIRIAHMAQAKMAERDQQLGFVSYVEDWSQGNHAASPIPAEFKTDEDRLRQP